LLLLLLLLLLAFWLLSLSSSDSLKQQQRPSQSNCTWVISRSGWSAMRVWARWPSPAPRDGRIRGQRALDLPDALQHLGDVAQHVERHLAVD
jgi:hypothetical protein